MLAVGGPYCRSVAASGAKLVSAHRACAMRCRKLEQQHMGGDEDLHLGHGGAAEDDVVGCGAVDNEEGSSDCPPLGCRSNRDWEMNASNGLDHLTEGNGTPA
ncbi:unnamed protein product [Prunus armeniaca]